MKTTVAILLIILCFSGGFAQKPKSSGKIKPAQTAADSNDEKDALAKAVAIDSAAERLAALQKFIADYPNSAEKTRAAELIVSARAQIGEEKLQAGEREAAVESFKAAVADAPMPVSEKLFAEVLMRFPTNLFFGGERAGATEVAHLIEAKSETDAKRLIALATFFLGTENADESIRLAEKALTLEPDFATAFQTLGFAYRINFELEKSVTAYAKALELAPDSAAVKRSLAEMKRAVGKPVEAANLYREILTADASDAAARTGLILSLFDAEKRAEAETEMNASLEAAPNNLFLLVGAAYWYAAHKNGDKAAEFAQKALEVEPRYVWAYIALARGRIEQKKPLEAEKTLLVARQYGNFPTLDYEIAAARMQAGLYREAADELKNSFAVKDDKIFTRLGGRIETSASSFIELLSPERRAGIFQPLAADDPARAQKLKSLLGFTQELGAPKTDESKAVAAAENFVSAAGDDKMTIHRQLYVAERLLEKSIAPAKSAELAQSAIGKVDAALDVPNAAAAVLAEELYPSRKIAISRGEILITPDVPRRTLSAILRGRIEEIAAWSLYKQNKPEEAVVRLKRALSVLPEKSAWWRSSQWRLGTALEAVGKNEDALAAYVKSYNADENARLSSQYLVIETLYRKIKGTTEGLEKQVGERPADLAAESVIAATGANDEKPDAPVPEPTPETASSPEIETPVAETTAPPLTENKQTETIAEIVPESTIKETKTAAPEEKKITENAPEKTPEKKSETDAKSLFEPIIIRVPSAAKTSGEKKPKENPPLNSDEQTAEKPIEAAPPENTDSNHNGESRQRVVVTTSAMVAPCRIVPSRESVVIPNDGESPGILIAVQGGEANSLEKINFYPTSPLDVSVTLDPQISPVSGRLYFIIKSVSKKKGLYSVIFDLPCDRKIVDVRVK